MPDAVRCLFDPVARPGAWNMALDEALLASARAGAITLRLYLWEPGCISFGRNQVARDRYDAERAAALGINFVRRPTGGRAVFHHRELTYSFTAPEASFGGLRKSYARINCALAVGLQRLGVPIELAIREKGRRLPRPTTRACFRDPAPGEVIGRGRKLIGSAQWREGGALLQHGSLLIRDEQSVVDELLLRPPRTPPVRAASLDQLLPAVPGVEVLVEALCAGFACELERPIVRELPVEAEISAAEDLERKYRNHAWTWRR